jgi:hypothetical protein
MSWTTVRQVAKGDDQAQGTYNPDDGTVKWTTIQTWIAITDGATGAHAVPTGTPYDAANASAGGFTIPALASDIIIDGTDFTVSQVVPKRTGPNSFEIRVQADWTYQPPKSNNKWNIQINFGGVDYEQDATKDKDGKAIVNSAGQPFDPTLKHSYSDETISISYSTTLEQSESFAGIRGCVNSSSVTLNIGSIDRTFGERTIKCNDAEQAGDISLSDGTSTYKVSLNFTVRSDGYVDNVLDQGFYETDSDGELIQIKDKWGDSISAPVPLDGNGNQNDPNADPVFLTFKIETEADFTSAFEGLDG